MQTMSERTSEIIMALPVDLMRDIFCGQGIAHAVNDGKIITIISEEEDLQWQ